MSATETLKQLRHDAISGALGKATSKTLDEYAAALCHPRANEVFGASEFPQISETVRIHLLRAHISELQDHITSLDEKNTKLSKLVVVLTVVATVSAIAQTTVAILPYAGITPSSPPAAAPQKPAPPQSAPSPPAPQAPGQPTKKTP